MEGTQAATDATSPAVGVGGEFREMNTRKNGFSGKAHAGPRQGGSESSSIRGGKQDADFAEEWRPTKSEEGSLGSRELPLLTADTAGAHLRVNTGPKPPIGSSSASDPVPAGSSVYDPPPAATSGDEGPVDAGGGGEMLSEGGIGGANTFHSTSLQATAASAVTSLTSFGAFYTSPSVSVNYTVAGRAPAGGRLARLRDRGESEHTGKLHPSFLSKRQEEGFFDCSPLPTGREDDILEFIVQRPTTGGTLVPGFVVTKGGAFSSASPPPPCKDGGLVQSSAQLTAKSFICVPVREATKVEPYLRPQPRLVQNEQRGEESLQDVPPRLYTSPPGAFVLLRPAQEAGKEAEFVYFADESVPTFSSFVPSSPPPFNAKTLPSSRPPEHYPPPYLSPCARHAAEDTKLTFFPFVPRVQNLPARTPWQVCKKAPPLACETTPVPVIQCSEPPPSPLIAQGEFVKEKVVISDVKRFLCFGHAGDEIKFCFGILQLPPPPIKYDFLLERKRTCFGLCGSTKYLAVCRRCRMRLPECPFCHKQSAIRHP